MQSTTPDEIREMLQKTVIKTPRKLRHQHDWGDNETRGICLKRKGIDFYNLRFGKDFAIYLGEHNNQYYIGLTDIDMNIVEFGKYESLQELKYEWMCD